MWFAIDSHSVVQHSGDIDLDYRSARSLGHSDSVVQSRSGLWMCGLGQTETAWRSTDQDYGCVA